MERKALLNILEKASPGLADKEIIEQSDHFIFSKGYLYTYNDEIFVRVPCPDLKLKKSVCVPAREVRNLLAKMTDKEITFSLTAEELVIKGKRKKAGILIQKKISLPIKKINIPDEWKTLPTGILEAIEVCLPSCGTDMTELLFTCVCIHKDKVMSTNSEIMAVVDVHGKSKDFLIQSTNAAHLPKYNFSHYQVKKGWIFFKDDETGLVFGSRTIKGEYPISNLIKLRKTIRRNPKRKVIVLPKQIKDTLERSTIFTSNMAEDVSAESIKITLEKGTISIKGRGIKGWYEETSKIKYKGPTMFFSINPNYLHNVLQHTRKMIYNNDPLRPMFLFEYDTISIIVSGVI